MEAFWKAKFTPSKFHRLYKLCHLEFRIFVHTNLSMFNFRQILYIFQVEGGSFFSIKASWSQQILYQTDRFCLRIPFNFPSYVNPVGKKISKTERISLNINPGTAAEVLCKSSSHPLKVKSYYHKFPLSCWIYIWFTNYWYVSSSCLQNLKRQGNKLSSSYEAEVVAWSSSDFNFAYTVRILNH